MTLRKFRSEGVIDIDDGVVVPPPTPVPTPVPIPPTTDPNMEFKGDFSKPAGTTLAEKTGDGQLFVTSGTLKWGAGLWTSNSSTFRVITLKDTFTDVAINMKVRMVRWVASGSAYDGFHLFARYRSQYHLYAISVFRRDQTATLKKKCPGGVGDINDPHGTYYDFTSVPCPYVLGTWYDVQVLCKNDASDTMKLTLNVNGKLITTYSDNGRSKAGVAHICTQIMRGGAVGIRTDNCEWEVKDFAVTSRFPYP